MHLTFSFGVKDANGGRLRTYTTCLTRRDEYPGKGLKYYDFAAIKSVNKQKVLELAHGEWVQQHSNLCLLGQLGTGKTHLAIALGLAACCEGIQTKFFAAAALVNQLEGLISMFR